tara:strand:+ start:614 stop:1258 length:645 start_codon:yes stop_codon:yes gene_type:complete
MDMKLDSALIKKLRNEKHWSQDELATACGISLRTIQRIENDGSASSESLKALAAVFKLESNTLLLREDFKAYQHTQIGWTILLILLLVYGMLDYFLLLPNPARIILTVIAVLFCTLTVRVSETEILWFFGPGLIRKHEKIHDIENCSRVSNKWWWGWGIRFHPIGQWLYNVSGFDAVEIKMKSGRRFRIGTDEPNYLEQAINSALRLPVNNPNK